MSALQSLFGLIAFPLIAYLFSGRNRQPLIPLLKLVAIGLALQLLFGVLLLNNFAFLQYPLELINNSVNAVGTATTAGTSFLFGYLGGGELPFDAERPQLVFLFAFRVLPIVIVMSALSAILFHLGILPFLIRGFSKILNRAMAINGAEGFAVAANVFVGMVEAPLLVRPYLQSMSRSQLLTLMTAGMATVAGTVVFLYAAVLTPILPNALTHIITASLMSAPAAIIIAKIMIPEIHDDKTTPNDFNIPRTSHSTMDALVSGANTGMQIFASIIAIILVFFALVSIVNQLLALIPTATPLTIEYLLSFLFLPITWLMGIPVDDLFVASELMSTKLVLNELVSYTIMSSPETMLSETSKLILTYAMCGFANFGSLGIIVGGLSAIIPDRRPELIELGFKSIFAGTLATSMTGALVNLFNQL